MQIAYKTTARATGGRDGHAATIDGTLEVKLSIPRELGGPGGGGNNPEQLFACGYAACYLGALKFVASQQDQKLSPDSTVTATVGIGKRDDGTGFGLDVELAVYLPGIEQDSAKTLTEQAHVVCPYSHATKGNIDVRTLIS